MAAIEICGNVLTSTQTTSGTTEKSFSYEWYLNGALKKLTYPSGRVVNYGIDDGGRTNMVSSTGRTYADLSSSASMTCPGATCPFAPDGRIKWMALGNGLYETRDYMPPGTPTYYRLGTTLGGEDRLKLEYNYSGTNNNRNLLSQRITRNPGNHSWFQSFAYDELNRLESAMESSGYVQNYDYDRWGNRAVTSTGLANDEEVSLSAFGSNNRFTSAAGAEYDAAGNLTGYGTADLTYDGEGRMTVVTIAGSGSVTYAYDGDGRRVKKTWNPNIGSPVTTYYVYDSLGRLAAEYSNESLTTGTNWIFTDMLGSVRALTSETGTVVECYDYLPFGAALTSADNGRGSVGCYLPQSNSRTPQKFTGKERDAETGLDYFGARYYSAPQGRFTSTDPLNIPNLQQLAPEKFGRVIANPQNWNGYAYAHNNPLTKLDPDGFLTIIVPGTGWSEADWNEDSEFYKRVKNTFKDNTLILPKKYWSGGNTRKARSAAAGALAEMIKDYDFAPGEKLNIVANSHGGNVAFQASSDLGGHTIDNLVTLGTPIRPDYAPTTGAIGNHVNVFSQYDGVQTKGGFLDTWTLQTGYVHLEVGPAARKLGSATNIEAGIKSEGWMDTHSALWQRESVWRKIEPLLKK